MKTYKETAYDVLTRVRQEQEERKMKQKRMKWIIPAAVMLLVLLGAGIFEIIKNRNGHSGGDAGNEEMLESALQAVGRDVVHRPVVLTSEEALTHADQRLEGYKQQLNASGVPVESVHVRGNAFAMLNLETDKNELADDFREVFLYDQDNKLKGSVTLWKENGTIYESLAFGSKWFDEFSGILDKYQGQELICIFFRFSEVFIAPDNKIIVPQGYETNQYFPAGTDYYKAFKTKENVYIP